MGINGATFKKKKKKKQNLPIALQLGTLRVIALPFCKEKTLLPS